jgi:hypothetical protein
VLFSALLLLVSCTLTLFLLCILVIALTVTATAPEHVQEAVIFIIINLLPLFLRPFLLCRTFTALLVIPILCD